MPKPPSEDDAEVWNHRKYYRLLSQGLQRYQKLNQQQERDLIIGASRGRNEKKIG